MMLVGSEDKQGQEKFFKSLEEYLSKEQKALLRVHLGGHGRRTQREGAARGVREQGRPSTRRLLCRRSLY